MITGRRRAGALGAAALVAIFFLPVFARASQTDPSGDPDAWPDPPPSRAAVAACKAKTVHEACTMKWQDDVVSGQCVRTVSPARTLYCDADRPAPLPPFFQACAGKAAGASCSLEIDGDRREGRCRKGMSERLLCWPG